MSAICPTNDVITWADNSFLTAYCSLSLSELGSFCLNTGTIYIMHDTNWYRILLHFIQSILGLKHPVLFNSG